MAGSGSASGGSAQGLAAGPCYVYRCQLRWADFDAYRHVNNVRYLELFQDARIDFANSVLPDPRGLESATVVARQEVDYLVPIGYRPGTVDVVIRVTRVGASSATVAFQICDSAGEAGLRRSTVRPGDGDRSGGDADAATNPGGSTGTGSDRPTVYARGSCVVVAYDLAAGSARRLTSRERDVFALIAGPDVPITPSDPAG